MLEERDIGIAKQLFIGFLCLRTTGTPRFHESTEERIYASSLIKSLSFGHHGAKSGEEGWRKMRKNLFSQYRNGAQRFEKPQPFTHLIQGYIMKRIVLPLILLASIGYWPAANACQSPSAEAVTLEVSQQKQDADYKSYAQYEEGEMAMMKHINSNIKYPASAIDKKIQGVCIIGFTVTTKGTITGIHVKKSLHKDMDEEAIRVIKSLPGKWKPAVNKKGKKVACNYTLPIRFSLR